MYSRGFSKAISILIMVLVIGAVLGMYAYYYRQPTQTTQAPTLPITATQTPTSTAHFNLPTLPTGWIRYTDPDFHLTFGYPASWTYGGVKPLPGQPGTPTYSTVNYSNADGTAFFFSGSDYYQGYPNRPEYSLDDEVASQQNSHLKPYGSNPTIQKRTIDGHDARLVVPSSDGQKNTDTLYIQTGSTGIFYLQADSGHIEQIIQTVKFAE